MKYNFSSICRAANIMTRNMSRSQAFRIAWAMAKGQAVEKVAGVRFGQRQAALQHLTQYPEDAIRFFLIRERDNHFDRNAVAVAAEVIGKGQYKMGYLDRAAAALMAPMMDRGVNLRAGLKAIVGGYLEGMSYGLRLQVSI